MFKRIILLASLASAPAQAGQPIHVSMAECAGFMLALVEQIKTPSPRLDRVVGAQQSWARAAQDEAAGEDIAPLIAQKAEVWRAKGPLVVYTEDFKDWAAYCRSLAKHKGLKIDPGA